jgi:hypothetical protein
MSNINQNSKSIFARLLATEDITVVHTPTVQTASFDLASRTMHLPVWKDMNHHLYDMLIAHEVGHAIYTPNDKNGWEDSSKKICPENPAIGQMYLNIVEDARIERLIQKKYPGSKKDFWFGYEDLFDRDIFDLKDKDPKELNLLDRLNLKFKVGPFVDVGEFAPDEQVFLNRMETAETWDDVVAVATDLYSFMAQQVEKEEESNMSIEFGEDGKKTEDSQESESSAPAPKKEGEGNNSSSQQQAVPSEETSSETTPKVVEGSGTISATPVATNIPIPNTQKSLEENLQKVFVDEKASNVKSCLIPEPKIDNIILSQTAILNLINDHIRVNYLHSEHGRNYYNNKKNLVENIVREFQKASKPSVDLLCKQFEMKKAADVHKRTSVRRTGLLNMDRLHQYKMTDNIFLSRNTTKEGKNHGLVMFLDWSGSMGNVLADTIRQMMVMMAFCRRCNIPYEIYAFSNRHPILNWDNGFTDTDSCMNYLWDMPRKDMPYLHFRKLCLFNLFSSSTDKHKEFEMLVHCMGYALGYERDGTGFNKPHYMDMIPGWFTLNSTPLEETLGCIPVLHEQFVKKYGRQINHTVILTDGEGDGAGSEYCHNIMDPKTRARYDTSSISKIGLRVVCARTQALVDWVKDRTSSRIVCMQLYPRHGSTHYVFEYGTGIDRRAELEKKNNSQWNKESYIEVPNDLHAFDSYFIVKAKNAFVTDDFEEIDTTNMTPTKIKTSFIKHQKKKFMSRYMINRFVEMIAV